MVVKWEGPILKQAGLRNWPIMHQLDDQGNTVKVL